MIGAGCATRELKSFVDKFFFTSVLVRQITDICPCPNIPKRKTKKQKTKKWSIVNKKHQHF